MATVARNVRRQVTDPLAAPRAVPYIESASYNTDGRSSIHYVSILAISSVGGAHRLVARLGLPANLTLNYART